MGDSTDKPTDTDVQSDGAEPEHDDLDNLDLQDVLSMMAEEVERLKVSLEYFRLTDHPDKEERIRWHVEEIDRRQDRLESLKALILASSDDNEH